MSAADTNRSLAVIKTKCKIPDLQASGLVMIYLNKIEQKLLGIYTTLVKDDALFSLELKKNSRALVTILFNAQHEYQFMPDLNKKLHDTIWKNTDEKRVSDIIAKAISKDIGSIDHLIRKDIAKTVLNGNIHSVTDTEFVDLGEFLEINAMEKIEKLTISQQTEIALQYAKKNKDIAEQIVKKKVQDMALINFELWKNESIFGAGIIFFSLLTKTIHKIIIATGSSSDFQSVSSKKYAVEFYNDIKEKSSEPSKNVSVIERLLSQITVEDLYAVLKEKDLDSLKKLMESMLVQHFPALQIPLQLSFMNSLLIDILFDFAKDTEKATEEDQARSSNGHGLQVINVNFVVSPARGRSISSLQPGDSVQVIVDASTPLGMKIMNDLQLFENEKVKPLGGIVHSLKRNEKDEYVVFVKLSNNLYGKAIEEEDVRIKTGDPVVEYKMKKSTSSMVIGLISAALVLLILAVVAWIFY